jgi:hypothetical protein
MALIKRKVAVAAEPVPAPAYVSREQAATVICKSPDKLKAVIDLVEPGVHVHYVSDGDWSMHDLVVSLLEKYGPAELYTTTYALREFPMRQLILAKERGDVTTIKMLIDYRAKMRTPEVYQLASMNLTDIRLIAIHAKVAVIRSAQACVSIVCSSNWTQNPRIEAGSITMDADVAHFHIDWIEKTLQNAEIFS